MESIAEHNNLPLFVLESDDELPFSQLRSAPVHDEPNLTVLSWALLSKKMSIAKLHGANVLLHGIGGDQVFEQRIGGATLTRTAPRLGIASLALKYRLHKVIRSVRREVGGKSGYRFVNLGTMLYDGWADRYLGPRHGVRYEPGLTSLPIIRAARQFYLQCPNPNRYSKHVIRTCFADDLPEAVLQRRSKVGFDGVYQRGARRHFDDAIGMLEAYTPQLENLGIRPGKVIKELSRIASIGWESDATPALAVLAWCAWIHGLQRSEI